MIKIEKIKEKIDELHIYNPFFLNYLIAYNNFEYMISHHFGDNYYSKKYEDLVDYIDILTKDEMPTLSIARQKKKLIDNNPLHDISFNPNKDFSYPVNSITFYELLGLFTVLDKDIIEELISKGKDKIHGENISELIGKKVIFICQENIEEFCDNVNMLNNNSPLSFFDVDRYDFSIDFENDIKKHINKEEMFDFVLLHELGHSYFYTINPVNNYKLKERQANYFASVALRGTYDNVIELVNNRVEEYKDPLLISHMYTNGITKFVKDRKELYEGGNHDRMER